MASLRLLLAVSASLALLSGLHRRSHVSEIVGDGAFVDRSLQS